MENRGKQIIEAISQAKSAIANRYCQNATEEMGNRRFMSNPRIENQQIKEASYAFCRERVKGKRVLAIQDTTEINYQKHAGRLTKDDPNLGPVGNNGDIGFFLHPVLVVEEESGFPLGFSSIQEWNRDWEKESKEQRKYKQQAIEEKESFRWIAAAEETKRHLKDASHILVIGDRESDIYEEFVRVADARCDVLVRCAQDRRLDDREETLFDYLASLPVAGEMELEVQGNKKRAKRRAQMEIRYGRVKIARPANRKKEPLPPYVEVSVIEIREKEESVPEGEEPIRWRLVTTLDVSSVAEACQCARWYARRWWIEELFRVLKKQGLDLEGAQWESGSALKRLAIMTLQAALPIMQLTAARAGIWEVSPETVFTGKELEFQEQLLPHVEGRTLKQKNPYPRTNLAWSAWIIARLGGWKTYYSRAKPPGPITMKRGLERFYSQFSGWCIASSSHT